MYAYNADIYCDRCGKAILTDLDRPTWSAIKILKTAIRTLETTENSEDFPPYLEALNTLHSAIEALTFPSDTPQELQDSDAIPVWADDDQESDSPQHCASGDTCLDALTLSDGRKVGSLIGSSLTSEGRTYVIEAITEKPDDPLMQEWAARYEVQILHFARLYSYCGMTDTLAEDTDLDSVRASVAAYLRDMRAQGYDVAIRRRGHEYEVLEPEDSVMVPDACGILSIETTIK